MRENSTGRLTEREQDTFYIMKALACISVIAAHINHYVADTGAAAATITGMWGMFARCGVVIYFILSGMFFKKESDLKLFIKKKFRRLVIPWLICAGITYLFKLMLTHKISAVSVMGYFCWLIGKGSWYYYMTVLMVFMLLFQFLNASDGVLFVCMGVTVGSIGLLTANINYISALYLNPLNWVGFFAIGMLLGRYRFDKWLLLQRKKVIWAAFAIFAVTSFINIRLNNFTYFNLLMVVTELSGAVLVFYGADWLTRLNCPWKKMGESTFFIYLIHMQIVQAVSAALPDGPIKYLLDPLIGFGVMLLIVALLYKVFSHGSKGKKLLGILGISKG